MIVRLAIVSLIYLGLHAYFYIRLIRKTELPRWPRFAAIGLLAVGTLLVPAVMALARYAGGVPQALVLPAFFWLALGLYLLMALLDLEVLRPIAVWVIKKRRPEWIQSPGRQLLVHRISAGLALATALILGGIAFYNARSGPNVVHVEVELDKLPAELDGFTIAQISDLHVGQTIGIDYVRSVAEQVRELNPDLIAITGDLVDGRPKNLGARLEPLLELKPPQGIFFVTGNHDYYSGVEPWVTYLRSQGVRVLRNARVAVETERGGFDLAGVEDSYFAADTPRALAGRDPDRLLILLAHQPKEIFPAAKGGVDLQLSGHTHGGQTFPLTLFAPLIFPYVSGLHTHGETKIYVSRGTGYVGPPVRLGAPSEISLIRLRSIR